MSTSLCRHQRRRHLLDDESGYFCGEPQGVRPDDRESVTGSLASGSGTGPAAGTNWTSHTLDAHVAGPDLSLNFVVKETVISTEYPSYRYCDYR